MSCKSFGIVIFLFALVPTLSAGEVKIRHESKLVYAKAGDIELQLDIMWPADGKGPYSAVVCIHGGGWRGGSRHTLQPVIEQFAKNKFVAITISYRFAPTHRFPAQVEDAKAAVRWLRANADKYKINPDKIGAMGFSAGGHLACMLGAADESAGFEGNGGNPKFSTKIQAVVSFFGPTDFVEKNWTDDVENIFLIPFLGATYKEKKDLYRQCSPIVYCKKGAPPFLFFHGSKDPLVGIDHSEKMVKSLREVGASAELITMPGDGHGWGGDKLKMTINQSLNFFKDKLQK